MSALSATNALLIADKSAAFWLAALGTDAGQMGLRTVGATAGAYKKTTDLETLVIGLADTDQILTLLPKVQNLRIATDAYNAVGTIFKTMLEGLDAESLRSAGVASLSGVNDFNSFATYYNTGLGGAWNCLLPTDFRELYYAVKKQYPTASNIYLEVLQGATYSNALRKHVVGTGNTAGFDIDSTKYAGGFGQLRWSGATGSGVVTVTGNWRAVDGTIVTGAGTATLTGASGTATLTPPAGAMGGLLLTVTLIAAAAGVTAGTIYAEATKPSGRTNPPT